MKLVVYNHGMCLFSRLIKLASYYLNYLIGIGAIVLYVDTFFFVVPTTNPDVATVFCNLTPWLTAIGYSLCYGTILAKMARVYYIFNNPTAKKKVCGLLQLLVISVEYDFCSFGSMITDSCIVSFQGVQDWVLILCVAAMVGVDLTILVIYMLVEGLGGNLDAQLVPNRENPSKVKGVS